MDISLYSNFKLIFYTMRSSDSEYVSSSSSCDGIKRRLPRIVMDRNIYGETKQEYTKRSNVFNIILIFNYSIDIYKIFNNNRQFVV